MSGWVDILMATLVSNGGQGAEAPLVRADYRKFGQCELATPGYSTAVRESQQVPKIGVTALLLATLFFVENVVVGEEG